ncbi:MAG TPA: hypothetical protein VMY87_09995, partial [Armatimonadota bacterium]|nr:hypothetical protein [Armatimonadota bacterium]
LPEAGDAVNLHCHTFFSYNVYGYSPAKFAWLARRAGLAVGGIMDFDVLDGLAEFQEAARAVGLKACVGIETRVFLPEYAEQVMNSPGEPGICYHVGAGFPTADLSAPLMEVLAGLRATSAERNRQLIERVNAHLRPVALEYERDVLPLTPSGNATERHICLAYVRKARAAFPSEGELAGFWSERLGVEAGGMDVAEGIALPQAIRAGLMKQGGPGYVQPDAGSFPSMKAMNRFIVEAGGIAAYAWLDGTSEGEDDIEPLIATAMSSGADAINIVPDRNYTPGKRDVRLDNLERVVGLAEELGLPVIVGTEMNSPGQKFVDDFESDELAPLLPVFLKGAHIVTAHAALERAARLGYASGWARRNFPDRRTRSEFYESVGRAMQPSGEGVLAGVEESTTPGAVLNAARRTSC